MKRIAVIWALFCSLLLFICSCETTGQKEKSVALETEKDSVSYLIGANMARSLMNIKDEISLDMLICGMKDQFNEKPLLMTDEEAERIMRDFSVKMQRVQEEKARELGKKNLEEGSKFLEGNKKKEGVVTTKSGLQYLVLKQGDGPKPAETDTVEVHYRGTTIEGAEFDSSYKRGNPATFPVTGVIKGWTEALLLMNVGGKYKLFIPSELGYGERGAGQNIGPNAVLIFEVELLDIKKE